MSDIKFSGFGLVSTLVDTDNIPILRNGTPKLNKRVSMLSAYNYIASKLSTAGIFVASNTAITAATKTKITYDSKGLVTAGDDATTDDIAEGSNLYHTNARVLATALAGLSITGSSISSSDTILQAFGKLQSQVNGVLGGAIYKGVWNASTNSPSLASSTGTKGNYYVVNVAGSTNLDGTTDWKVGDWAIFNGTTWDKVDNTDAVSSVNGSIGPISLTGTTNRITVTGNVWDIAATYVGQSSITTLGTIATGVWNGTAIADSYISSASTWNAKLSASLTSAYLFIGNGSNIATGVAMSGDSTITNAGVITNTGLKGVALPTLAAGYLRYTGSAWSFDNTTYATDSLTMHLAGSETVTGAKTFLATTLLLRNVANTFNGSFTNTNTADRVYTLPDATTAIAGLGVTQTFTAVNTFSANTLLSTSGVTRVNNSTIAWQGGAYTPTFAVLGTPSARSLIHASDNTAGTVGTIQGASIYSGSSGNFPNIYSAQNSYTSNTGSSPAIATGQGYSFYNNGNGGYYNYLSLTSSGTNSKTFNGFANYFYFQTSGGALNLTGALYGIRSTAQFVDAASSGITVASLSDILLENPTFTSGTTTITERIGLNIAFNNSNVTNAWGVYQSQTGVKNYYNGTIGIKTSSPTSYLHLGAGTATANTAPQKYTAGVLLSSFESGASETDSVNDYFYSNAAGRARVAMWQYVSKTANYTATNADYTIDCTANTFTLTLPTAVGLTGRVYVIKNSGTGVVTIATTSSQTIDGSTTQTLSTQYSSYRLQSNGTNWIII
jgi:hypothetical protein